MGIAGYVSVCVQLYCVGFHCLSLYVSAYMAIFKCAGYFMLYMLEGFCFAVLFCLFFKWSHSACFHPHHRWKHAECDLVKKRQKKSSEAESFKHMKINYPAHLKMAM
jgi:hypothetical protein